MEKKTSIMCALNSFELKGFQTSLQKNSFPMKYLKFGEMFEIRDADTYY